MLIHIGFRYVLSKGCRLEQQFSKLCGAGAITGNGGGGGHKWRRHKTGGGWHTWDPGDTWEAADTWDHDGTYLNHWWHPYDHFVKFRT